MCENQLNFAFSCATLLYVILFGFRLPFHVHFRIIIFSLTHSAPKTQHSLALSLCVSPSVCWYRRFKVNDVVTTIAIENRKHIDICCCFIAVVCWQADTVALALSLPPFLRFQIQIPKRYCNEECVSVCATSQSVDYTHECRKSVWIVLACLARNLFLIWIWTTRDRDRKNKTERNCCCSCCVWVFVCFHSTFSVKQYRLNFDFAPNDTATQTQTRGFSLCTAKSNRIDEKIIMKLIFVFNFLVVGAAAAACAASND